MLILLKLKQMLNRNSRKISWIIYICIFSVVLLVFKIFLSESSIQSKSLKSIINCTDKIAETEIFNNDKFKIYKNFVRPSKTYECHESITYVTHGGLNYLENLVSVLKRWQAPVSLAMYTPGSDFVVTLNAIFYYRNCHDERDLVKNFTSFHFFYENFLDDPEEVPENYELYEVNLECAVAERFLKIPPNETFKSRNNLDYPINEARNIARNATTTHFVLVSDIELYPNPNFVTQFLEMITRDEYVKLLDGKNVFPLPVFEIEIGQTIPDTKSELVNMYNKNKVFWFHINVCQECHLIPEPQKWLEDKSIGKMRIHTTAKRHGRYHHWEPFYVGTNDDPFFDNRQYYQGSSDKMPQMYIMCLLDFNFNVLSNGFLIHKNGIKTAKEAVKKFNDGKKLVLRTILPEITKKYGKRDGCNMF